MNNLIVYVNGAVCIIALVFVGFFIRAEILANKTAKEIEKIKRLLINPASDKMGVEDE